MKIQLTDKGRARIRVLLIAGSILAALKCILVGIQVDEEYAVSMSYRMLLGDRLFAEIWDPHQTSAFLMEFFLWIYRRLFGTINGSVIWVRFWGTLIQGGMAYGIYRMLKENISEYYSFLLGILYFNLSPKGFSMPEFSNMAAWSLTGLLLTFYWLEKSENRKKRRVGAVVAGIWICLMVLSYPSTLLLFPFAFVYLLKGGKQEKGEACIFALTCILGGILYLVWLFSYMSPAEFTENVRLMLQGNGSHTGVETLEKVKIYLYDILYLAVFCAGYGLLTLAGMQVCKKSSRLSGWYQERDRQDRGILAVYLLLLFAAVIHILHWILMLHQYEMSYTYAVYLPLLGIAWFLAGKLDGGEKRQARFWLLGNLLLLVAVLLLTNLTVYASVKYMLPGVVMALAVLVQYSERKAASTCRGLAGVTLTVWCLAAIFAKGWCYNANEGVMQNITCVRGIVSEGPVKGVLTEYMQGYIEESMYEEMQEYVEPGSNLFLLNMGSIGYMLQDVNVASYTTICDPRYNEVLLDYWERHPEKYPDVVAVSCWYGELKWDPDSWIMQWITNEFEAEQIIDGKYFRYYMISGSKGLNSHELAHK